MPPTPYNDFQTKTLVAYLRSMAVDAGPGATGDAGRGKALFENKGQCATCHRVRGVGSRLGPDLTEIGAMRRAVELERALTTPETAPSPGNLIFRGAMRDGTAVSGRFLNQDTFAVQILDSKDRLISIPKSNLRESNITSSSSMPSYRNKLTAEELSDVVTYLTTLKGAGNQ